MKKRTRLKIGSIVNTFLAAVTIYAIDHGMETVATTAIAGILTITTGYIASEGLRPSKQPETTINTNTENN